MAKVYTGVGSRETPAAILNVMTQLAKKLESEGWILRTGNASGADAAFRKGVLDLMHREVYTASEARNHLSARVRKCMESDFYELHPAPQRCSEQAKLLLMRNGMELMGAMYNKPSRFVVCWTPNAAEVGGTGQTLRLARKYGVQVFNLANEEHLQRILAYISR